MTANASPVQSKPRLPAGGLTCRREPGWKGTGWFGGALVFLFLLAACRPTSQTPPEFTVTAPQAPIPVSPTPWPVLEPGQAIVYQGLQVRLAEVESTAAYTNQYGIVVQPATGNHYVWVQVALRNLSSDEQSVPGSQHYSLLAYGSREFKPVVGHHRDHPDYPAVETATLGARLLPNQDLYGWLRFELPVAAFDDASARTQFVYLPESIQISFFTPDPASAIWAQHPLFLWNIHLYQGGEAAHSKQV